MNFDPTLFAVHPVHRWVFIRRGVWTGWYRVVIGYRYFWDGIHLDLDLTLLPPVSIWMRAMDWLGWPCTPTLMPIDAEAPDVV